MVLTVIITMLQLAFFYLVPYFLMLAFSKHEVDFFSVMAASAFVQLLSSAVPLPGGTGGAEGGFALFLGHFFGSAATAGYLLWRLITFIAPTILAAPLLGLKSAHNASIHARWDRVLRRFGKEPSGSSKSSPSNSGHKKGKKHSHTSHHEDQIAAPLAAIGSIEGAPASPSQHSAVNGAEPSGTTHKKPVSRRTVRQSADGITVSPSQFKKKPRA